MMHFLQNEIWWLLFAICEFLVILIGLRERFRLRLLYTPYFRASAIVAIVLIILWIGIATTIAIMLGWLAASICLLLSLITGMMISLAFKRDDLDTIAERLDSLRDIAVLRAMHREEVRALLDAYDKNEMT